MEDNATRLVWIAMLAMADKYGRVWGSMPGLANRARVKQRECESALTKFLSPDKHSRTPDNEGRRIEVIRGGWRLLNHGYYRDLQDTESQKAYKAAWIREKRKRDRDAKRLGVDQNVDTVDKCRAESNGVDDIAEASPSPTQLINAFPPTQKPKDFETLVSWGSGPHCGLARDQCKEMWDHYEANGWTINGLPISKWESAANKWKNNQGKHEQRGNTGRIGNQAAATGEGSGSGGTNASRSGSGQSVRDKNLADCQREGIKPKILN